MKPQAVAAGLPSLGLPFSWGVRYGGLVFIAGQGPLGHDGKVVPGDVKVQTKQTLENVKKVVQAAGGRMETILSMTVYLSDLNDFAAMNEVYREYFPSEPRPARATVGADLLFGMRVEIQGIAYVPTREGDG